MTMLPTLPGNPEDRDQMVVTAPRRELLVTREPAGTVIHVVEPVAAATVAGGGLRAYVQTTPIVTAINGCGVNGPWTLAPSAWRLSVPAAVGDVIEWAPAVALGGQGAAAFDLAVVGSGGTVLRYLSSDTATPATLGHGGMYASGVYGAARLPVLRHQVQLGELLAGAITLGLAYRADPEGQMTLGHLQLASVISALNLGPTSGIPGG